jgi:hypothetical protein
MFQSAGDLFARHSDSASGFFPGRHGVHERRSLSRWSMLDSDRFDPATEDRMPLVKPVEGRIQLFDHCLGVISEDNQLHIDLSVSHFFPQLSFEETTPIETGR